MRTYRNLKWFFLAFTLAYAITGTVTWHWYKLEIFPIYSWDLFSVVPGEVGDFGVRIISVNGQLLPEAIFFQEATDLFAEANSIIAFSNFQTLGLAVRAGDEVQIATSRRQIETLYFKDYNEVMYLVVWRVYEPRQRWLTGALQGEEYLAEYIYRKGE